MGKALKTDYLNHLHQVVKVAKTISPEKIILFGSASSGKIKKESDLDICIIKKGDRIKIKREIWGRLWNAGYDWEIEPDIHIYDPVLYKDWLSRGDPFLEEIEKGKIIYAKE